MKSLSSKVMIFAGLAVLVIGSVSCGGAGNTGRLSLSLTDAATNQFLAVYVTIKEVDVHAADDPEDAWTVVATPNKTIDLLALANGVREQLALVDLAAGPYTQMRLIIGDTPDNGINILSQAHPAANYVIDSADNIHVLTVPSGIQTGVKIVQGFTINEGGTTELTLDFDASRSVVVAGQSGHFLLKPTIKVLGTFEASTISGTVTTPAAEAGQPAVAVEGALVSAQIFDPGAADPKDQVVVETSTVSDSAGAYKIFIAPGTYNLVATKLDFANTLGFAPLAVKITPVAGDTLTQDFSLTPDADFGTVALKATVAGAAADTFVTFSFRQTVQIEGADVVIEVLSISIVAGVADAVNVDLPGLSGGTTYTVVSSTAGKTTQSTDIIVTKGAVTNLDVSF